MSKSSDRLEQLDAELRDIFSAPADPAFPLLVYGWRGAAMRELARLEFNWVEIEQLVEDRLRGAIREARFTGVLPYA